MSPLDPERRRRIDDLFDEVLDLPSEARAARLREAAVQDPETAREVRSLLAAADRQGILDRDPSPALEDGLSQLLSDDDRLGERVEAALGGYRITRELGRGGMAVVYLAWEAKHERPVVLKVLRPEVAALYGVDRFLQEVHLAGRLSHPNILGLIDSGAVDGLLYYVMPWVEGESLRERLDREERLSLPLTLSLLRDVASALGHAHEHGVIHRDLKPANVLCAGEHAYLMDFGVAKSLNPDHGREGETRVGVAVGTPLYMAPEQSGEGEGVDGRADLFAWGQMARELLTASAPPAEPGRESLAARVTAIRRSHPRIPRSLADLVARCVEPDREDRPPGMGPVLRELDRVLTPGAVPGSGDGRGLRWAVGMAAVVVLLLALQLVQGPGSSASRDVGPAAGPGGDGGIRGPVAVAEFRNETGDSTLRFLGRLAGDWLTQGLQESGARAVVPWSMSLPASRRAEARLEVARDAQGATRPEDVVSVIHDETGAGTVVTGSFYRVGGEIRFQALVTDAVESRVVSAPEPVAAPLDSAEKALAELRSRVMASVAVAADRRTGGVPGLARRPPTFEAYRAFDRGMDRYLAQDYEAATTAFLRAHEADSTFLVALLYGATTAYNRGAWPVVDSVLDLLEERRDRLARYDDLRLSFLRALSVGEGGEALRAIRSAARLAPGSRSVYNLALRALSVNRPREALEALESLDPDAGEMRGWAQYWTQRAHAHHLLGQHEEEARAAAAMRVRHPERRVAGILQVRAHAAAGDTVAVDRVLASLAGLPGRSYWSPGAARVVAGEELQAHGRPEAARRYLEDGLAWLRSRAEQDPEYTPYLYWSATALYDLGRWEEAWAEASAGMAVRPGDTSLRATAAAAAARLGREGEAREWLARGFERAPGTKAAAEARVEAALGHRERAVFLLGEALQKGVESFPWYPAAAYPDLRELEADPRYRALMAGDAG
jgi:tetratricopeptide (TPR) repeat protein